MAHEHESAPTLTLPVSVVGRIDIGRLLREAEALDEFLNQAAIRQPGTPVKLPKTSRLLDEMIEINQLNVLHDDARKQLLAFLRMVKEHAPIIHVSFSADPSPMFTGKLMTWLRRELHPLLLMQVGLNPNIGAGVIVRTTNQHFDFSLRQRFLARKADLAKLLAGDKQQAAPQAAPQAEMAAQPAAPVAPIEQQPAAPQPTPPAAAVAPPVPAPEAPPAPAQPAEAQQPGGGA